jgi:N-acetylmuramoyl-L-alanine amidase
LLQSAVLGAMNRQGWQIPDAGVASDTGLGSAVTAADAAYGHLILLGPAKRGYFTTPSLMPGAVIEPLFITDPFEASIAASPGGQQVIATRLAHAVEEYFAAGPSAQQAAGITQPAPLPARRAAPPLTAPNVASLLSSRPA